MPCGARSPRDARPITESSRNQIEVPQCVRSLVRSDLQEVSLTIYTGPSLELQNSRKAVKIGAVYSMLIMLALSGTSLT